ncbi:UbiA family prenyltransferase, partial [Streptomyces thermoalcalitolerans]|uniref:UbiA family prenyltransferase n=1 Tax=Streptomyces thermoalcalitolerans TaxID=65605 RepID=UPI0031DACE25
MTRRALTVLALTATVAAAVAARVSAARGRTRHGEDHDHPAPRTEHGTKQKRRTETGDRPADPAAPAGRNAVPADLTGRTAVPAAPAASPAAEPSPVPARPALPSRRPALGTPADWAELLRLPALFTVPGDALAGTAAAGRTPGARTLLAIGSSLCLYQAGMALNDWADRTEDAAERPHRPLPSGRIAPGATLAAVGALTSLGLAL